VNLENLVTLRGNTHPLARPEYDQGAAPDSLPTERILLVLQRSAQQETALRKLLDQQQVKSSPNYHMWLTPEQFGEQFGPADADIQAVTDWLTSQGFQVSHVAAGRTVIEFSGTAGQVRQALHTEIHKYVVHGEEHWANASDPQIPAALAPVVAGFASLNNFPRKPMYRLLGTFSRSKATGKVQPLFTYPVACPPPNASETCYLLAVGPGDFATIYNLSPLYSAGTNGTGQTVAIVAETNINLQDVADFRSMFGLPANAPNIILNGPDPGIIPPTVTGDETESDLDVEWAGAVAPSATIDLVVSESTEVTDGVDLSALYIIDNNLAPIMSESYGDCEAALGAGTNAFYSNVWEQGAAEGITILEAAGDNGSAACDVYGPSQDDIAALFGLAVEGNASTPFNVAVGGTDFNDSSSFSTYWSTTNNSTTQASAKSYIPEMTWNDTCASAGSLSGCTSVSAAGSDLVGGGGGQSNCITYTGTFAPLSYSCTGAYAKPTWQTGTGVPADGVRDVPDVSLFAGNGANGSFYVFCEIDANDVSAGASATSCDLNAPYLDFMGAGGTSASAQAFGGIMALVNQKYGRQGNANYVLYPLAAESGASCESDATMAPTANGSSCIFYDIQTGNNSVACVLGYPNCNSSSVTSEYGILVNPSNDLQAAWVTTPGYDLATGLGTVNVANLVAKWPSASFTVTTTTLTITPPSGYNLTNIPHGQPVTVTVDVTPTTATGDVSLLGGPSGYNASCASSPCNLGISLTTPTPPTLSNGALSGTTNMLPGGTYGVTARYAGDGAHAASESSPVQVTVTAENSKTFLQVVSEDCNGNLTYSTTGTFTYGNSIDCSGVYYSQYWLRMDVTNSNGSLSATGPGGIAGACYSSSTGVPTYQCPTGQVTVTLNGSTMPSTVDVGAPSDNTPGTYTLNSQGNAEDEFIQLPVGTSTLAAAYEPHPIPPNNSYNPSNTSGNDSITINLASSTTTVSGLNPAPYGANETLTATVATASFGLAPTGTVTFYNGSNLIGGVPTYAPTPGSYVGLASLTAALTTTFTANASITAKYSGDVNYAASTSPVFSLTVSSQADFSLTASPTSFSVTPGETGLTVISASPAGGFTGTVTLTCAIPSAMSYTTCTLTPGSFTVSSTSSGSSNLDVATTAPSTALHRFNGPRWFIPSAGALLAAIFLLLIPGRKRRLKLAFGSLVLALLAAGFVACGGGSSTTTTGSSGTPTGTYTVTVTGTSGNLTQSVNVVVSVL
jgi:hypothetical protein